MVGTSLVNNNMKTLTQRQMCVSFLFNGIDVVDGVPAANFRQILKEQIFISKRKYLVVLYK